MTTVGEALVQHLEAAGTEVVFGIPGVHTIELYRGLQASAIRHITPRHEQSAGFMADGYARVSGRPGVAFLITGPGLTNCITAMGQARADSVPMLVISGINARRSLGKGLGWLHELPDQSAMMRTIALESHCVMSPEELGPALQSCFNRLNSGRPGPVHIEIPTDVMPLDAVPFTLNLTREPAPLPDLTAAIAKLQAAQKPVILTGGGAKRCDAGLTALAEKLDAPVIQTVNARGLMHGHPLAVPASASLKAVRSLIADADCILALGTELGPTDYDMYETGGLPRLPEMIRVDVCAEQLARQTAEIRLQADAADVLEPLTDALSAKQASGTIRAQQARDAAWQEIGAGYRAEVNILNALRDALPGALMVGDSTQPIYAANLYYDHDRPAGWFNASSGFGALGYGIPAAIGAELADPEAPVISLLGDGGAQFTLTDMMVAVEEKLPVIFIIWNNAAFLEIANAMAAADIDVVGCHPAPPDFRHIARAFSMPFTRVPYDSAGITDAVQHLRRNDGPLLVEIDLTAADQRN